MIQTVNSNDFHNAFNAIRPNNFTYEGLNRLFEYFEEIENDTGEAIELDVIAICCEYQESTIPEIIEAYDIEIDYERNIYMQVMDFLEKHTSVVGDTEVNTIVFQQF